MFVHTLGKTLRVSIQLGLLFCLPSPALLASKADPPPENRLNRLFHVAVHNDADLSPKTLRRAEEIASHVFSDAGLQVAWENCAPPGPDLAVSPACSQAVYPNRLQLRILRSPKDTRDSSFGLAYLSVDGTGCYAEIFLDRANDLHEKFEVSVATVLGHVASHEIAHLLLGRNSHAPMGIMQAHWHKQELDDAGLSSLRFTPAEAQIMRARLAAAQAQYAAVTATSARAPAD
jgi:hypothetical protein